MATKHRTTKHHEPKEGSRSRPKPRKLDVSIVSEKSEPKIIQTMVGEVVVNNIDWGDEVAQQKRVIDDNIDKTTNIRVAVRCRPPNKRELAGGEGGGVVVKVPGPGASDGVVVIGTSPFTFDLAFPMNTTQLEVFEAIGVDIVQCAFHGYNASLFAYGQTSSGKSFSMMGVVGSELVGIIPRISRLLFSVSNLSENKHLVIETSYLEIYNEKLRDLLSDGPQKGNDLRIRENPQLGVHVAGLRREVVSTSEETLAVIDHGFNQRTTAATLYNSESSRSHAVFEINIKAKYKDTGTGEDMVSSSRIALIDLAGSERSDKLGSKGAALKEGNNINKSLTVLGRCIRALVDISKGKNISAPFRESVLTWYLRDSLSGNAKTTMLAACSPVESNMEETLSTLRYAASAKNIKTAAKKNEDPAQAKIRELSSELEKLKKKLIEVEEHHAPMIDRKNADASIKEMSRDEKEKLLFELNSQMGLLQQNDDAHTQTRRKSNIAFNRSNSSSSSSYPCLSCLNKDDLLSHAMTIPLTNTSPSTGFTIGRTLSVSGSAATSTKNDFELNGMGIKSRHCCFFNAQSSGSDKVDSVSKLVVQPLSSGATVYVNGTTLDEVEEEDKSSSFEVSKPLQHLDRIILGPGRLFCLYLEKPLLPQEKTLWDYEACFQEMMIKVSSSTSSSSSLLNRHHQLSSKRRQMMQQLNQVQLEQIQPANMMACEMGVPIRFDVEVMVKGHEAVALSEASLDDYLELNEFVLVIRCLANLNVKIENVEELISESKRFDRKMKRTLKKEVDINDSQKIAAEKRKKRKKQRASILFDPQESLDDPPMVVEPLAEGKHTVVENNLENENGTDEVLFEISAYEFEDLLQSIKEAYTSISTLTGGLMNSSSSSSSSQNDMVRNVFDLLDGDRSGIIDKEELEKGLILFNSDPSFIAQVWQEEKLTENVSLNFEQFEAFLIRFMQRQFYKCIETTVTNRDTFVSLGGRDLQKVGKEMIRTLAQQQSIAMRSSFREAGAREGESPASTPTATSTATPTSTSPLYDLLQLVQLEDLSVDFINAGICNETTSSHMIQNHLILKLLTAMKIKDEKLKDEFNIKYQNQQNEHETIVNDYKIRNEQLTNDISTLNGTKTIKNLLDEQQEYEMKLNEIEKQIILNENQILNQNNENEIMKKDLQKVNLNMKIIKKEIKEKENLLFVTNANLVSNTRKYGELLKVKELEDKKNEEEEEEEEIGKNKEIEEKETSLEFLNGQKEKLVNELNQLEHVIGVKLEDMSELQLQLQLAISEGVESNFTSSKDENKDEFNASRVKEIKKNIENLEQNIQKILEKKQKIEFLILKYEKKIEYENYINKIEKLENEKLNYIENLEQNKKKYFENEKLKINYKTNLYLINKKIENLTLNLKNQRNEKKSIFLKLEALNLVLEAKKTPSRSVSFKTPLPNENTNLQIIDIKEEEKELKIKNKELKNSFHKEVLLLKNEIIKLNEKNINYKQKIISYKQQIVTLNSCVSFLEENNKKLLTENHNNKQNEFDTNKMNKDAIELMKLENENLKQEMKHHKEDASSSSLDHHHQMKLLRNEIVTLKQAAKSAEATAIAKAVEAAKMRSDLADHSDKGSDSSTKSQSLLDRKNSRKVLKPSAVTSSTGSKQKSKTTSSAPSSRKPPKPFSSSRRSKSEGRSEESKPKKANPTLLTRHRSGSSPRPKIPSSPSSTAVAGKSKTSSSPLSPTAAPSSPSSIEAAAVSNNTLVNSIVQKKEDDDVHATTLIASVPYSYEIMENDYEQYKKHMKKKGINKMVPNVLSVGLISASNLVASDFNFLTANSSDPRAKFRLMNSTATSVVEWIALSSVQRQTLNPTWNELFYLPFSTPRHLKDEINGLALEVKLEDWDLLKEADFLGKAVIKLSDLPLDGQPKKMKIKLNQNDGKTEDIPRGDIELALAWTYRVEQEVIESKDTSKERMVKQSDENSEKQRPSLIQNDSSFFEFIGFGSSLQPPSPSQESTNPTSKSPKSTMSDPPSLKTPSPRTHRISASEPRPATSTAEDAPAWGISSFVGSIMGITNVQS